MGDHPPLLNVSLSLQEPCAGLFLGILHLYLRVGAGLQDLEEGREVILKDLPAAASCLRRILS